MTDRDDLPRLKMEHDETRAEMRQLLDTAQARRFFLSSEQSRYTALCYKVRQLEEQITTAQASNP
jgi:hypothetical protein